MALLSLRPRGRWTTLLRWCASIFIWDRPWFSEYKGVDLNSWNKSTTCVRLGAYRFALIHLCGVNSSFSFTPLRSWTRLLISRLYAISTIWDPNLPMACIGIFPSALVTSTFQSLKGWSKNDTILDFAPIIVCITIIIINLCTASIYTTLSSSVGNYYQCTHSTTLWRTAFNRNFSLSLKAD